MLEIKLLFLKNVTGFAYTQKTQSSCASNSNRVRKLTSSFSAYLLRAECFDFRVRVDFSIRSVTKQIEKSANCAEFVRWIFEMEFFAAKSRPFSMANIIW